MTDLQSKLAKMTPGPLRVDRIGKGRPYILCESEDDPEAIVALVGAVCQTCKHSFIPQSVGHHQPPRLCKRTRQPLDAFSANYTACADLGNGCRAWEAKR